MPIKKVWLILVASIWLYLIPWHNILVPIYVNITYQKIWRIDVVQEYVDGEYSLLEVWWFSLYPDMHVMQIGWVIEWVRKEIFAQYLCPLWCKIYTIWIYENNAWKIVYWENMNTDWIEDRWI